MMDINDYLIIGVGIVVLLLVYYIVTRDAHYAKQTRILASAIEKLNHQMYALEQKLNVSLMELQRKSEESMSGDDLRYELEVGIAEQLHPLQSELKGVQQELEKTQHNLQERLSHVEENLKSLYMPPSLGGDDDERIVALYQQGIDIDTIAKELRLSKSEVEFVLKIKKLK